MKTPLLPTIARTVILLILLCITSLHTSKSYAGMCLLGLIDCETPELQAAREKLEADKKADAETLKEFNRSERIGVEIPGYTYRTSDLAHDIEKGWELILVVNRSEDPVIGQTLAIYLKGQLIKFWDVSTALEAKLKNKKRNRTTFATTNMGRFRVGRMDRDHYSSSWDEDLPYYISFGQYSWGIGFHGAPNRAAEKKIGQRASAGCVRLHKDQSEELFELVKVYKTLIIIQESAYSDADHVPSQAEVDLL